MSFPFKIKSFFNYLLYDRFWLTRYFVQPFYNFFIKKKLIDSFYKNNLDKILNIEPLDELILNETENQKKKVDVFDPVLNLTKKYPPIIPDLSRLYNLVRNNKPFTVLEFGIGYSTIIIAQALYENKKQFNNIHNKRIRNSKMFKLFSVDASQKWIDEVKKKIPDHLKDFINISRSDVEIKNINNQICHVYKEIPDINPEFIYLDGPHPLDPKENINNVSFQCLERTPISADILLLESTLLPGTRILVDGRTNNVRFLRNNFKRNFKFKWDRYGDVTHIILREKRLGKLNKLGFEYY